MKESDIRSRCRVNSNSEADTFVGLKCEDGDLSIHFPLGYHISEDNKGLRKDILLLLSTLAAYTERKESELLQQGRNFDEVDFPVQSYLYLIRDFLVRGYYKEREVSYQTGRRGKINWNRTIKTQRSYVQADEIYYLDFVTKKSAVKEDEIITLIHEYCVYESFERIGWLFTDRMPGKPRIMKKEKMFRVVLKEKLASTFNDRNRMLFRHMLAILDSEGDESSGQNYLYGTCYFEHVWEKMIDRVFGIRDKADYFPRTTWVVDGNASANAYLEPDTIMVYGNRVFILDAKYYKFGVTGRAGDLPGSASVNKQITYGEYVAFHLEFRERHGQDMKVYNAFLMPFDAENSRYEGAPEMVNAGYAVSSWKDNSESNPEEYQKVRGILLDVKTLMHISGRQEMKEIVQLAELIERS